MAVDIVVESRENGIRYAIQADHFDEEKHIKIRDLLPHETRFSYTPRYKNERTTHGSHSVESGN